MTQQQRDIKRKLAVLQHAQESGNVALTARRFGISRQCYYKWKHAHEQHGEAARKAACLCALPEVCIEVSQPIRVTSGQRACDDWTSHHESVIGFGKAQIVGDAEHKCEGLQAIMAEYSGLDDWDSAEDDLAEVTVMRIAARRLSDQRSPAS
jgi:nitroimidazol reductase NimA-like FMN-containing flavoprotein (pyridoxamine 5'-phosphate oxidase superfamily)